MWHEARRQEKKIRVMMVDYQKRADRRRQFYERIKLDPTQFLRVYGRPVKIHLDPAVALAADGPQIMQPWQGNQDILIDRYDVRTHIDYVPEVPATSKAPLNSDDEEEESRCCYERYRILVQNECAGVTEDQCLNQIYLDEQFGAQDFINPTAKKAEDDKRKVADKKAAIGYTYTDSTPAAGSEDKDNDEDEDESSDEEIDLDNILDIDALTDEQEEVLNTISVEYGMKGMDYSECLQMDRDEVEALRQARQLEEEKAQFSGRKSRRERRAFKEKRMKDRRPSPPSYAAKENPTKTSVLKALSSSRSRSRSPPAPPGVVQFITSFGDDSDAEGVVHGPVLPPPQLRNKTSMASSSSRSYRPHDDRSPARRRSPRRSKTNSSSSQRDSRTSRRSRSRSHGSRSRSRRSRSRSRRSRSRRSRSPRGRADRSSRNDHSRSRLERSRSRDRGRYGERSSRGRESGSRRNDRSRVSRGSSPLRSSAHQGIVARHSALRGRRSRSPSSKQQTKTTSRSTSSSSSSSRSSSPNGAVRKPSPPPIKSYRRPSLSSRSSSDSDNDDDGQTVASTGQTMVAALAVGPSDRLTSSNRSDALNKGILGKVEGTASKAGTLLTPQERLKRRMQLALNRQYKADKRAQLEKISKEEQQRLDREEELRVIAMQMRQRERERRHREREEDSRHDNGTDDRHDLDRSRSRRHRSSSRSRSHSSSRSRSHKDKRRRSRSKSSPKAKLVDY